MAKVVSAYNGGLEVESRLVYEGRPYYEAITQSEFDEMIRDFVL